MWSLLLLAVAATTVQGQQKCGDINPTVEGGCTTASMLGTCASDYCTNDQVGCGPPPCSSDNSCDYTKCTDPQVTVTSPTSGTGGSSPPGHYCDPTGGGCFPCPAGQFQDKPNQDHCNNCPTGTVPNVDKVDCEQQTRQNNTQTSAVPACNPCTSYAFGQEGKMQFLQDNNGKCWSTK